MKIYAFGDSHSILWVHFETLSKYPLKEHWLGFKGGLPITLYRFGNEGLNIKTAPVIIGNGHENHIPVKDDIIFYFYGYNDVQKNIWKHGSNHPDCVDQKRIIDELVINYEKKLLHNQDTFGIITVVSAIYSPPWSSTWHDTERLGTKEGKYHMTLYLNLRLQNMCARHKNFHFFDEFFHLTHDPLNKCIRKEYASDGGHIDASHASVLVKVFDNFIDSISNTKL